MTIKLLSTSAYREGFAARMNDTYIGENYFAGKSHEFIGAWLAGCRAASENIRLAQRMIF